MMIKNKNVVASYYKPLKLCSVCFDRYSYTNINNMFGSWWVTLYILNRWGYGNISTSLLKTAFTSPKRNWIVEVCTSNYIGWFTPAHSLKVIYSHAKVTEFMHVCTCSGETLKTLNHMDSHGYNNDCWYIVCLNIACDIDDTSFWPTQHRTSHVIG